MAPSLEAQFHKDAAIKAGDLAHRDKILRAIGVNDQKIEAMKASQFRNWETARRLAGEIKDEAQARLPELLESFERRINARGGKVLWAEDAAEARRHVLEIARRHDARSFIKSKSMTTEELDLNEFLEGAGMKVLESDLGELIVQLAGQKPYHIITPAMHMSKDDVAKLFHEKLGSDRDAGAEELTMIARRLLRKEFVSADVGVTGANFLIADEGAVVVLENEGNARLAMACPRVHIAIGGIEKVLPRMSDLALFLPLLSTSGTGQQVTSYNSIVRGPRAEGETDGPEHFYVILLDNGRSTLYGREPFRQALRCIRCGACLNACPVFRTVGGHTYGTTYQGPIGSVITPHLRGNGRWHHLPHASSLCGSCTSVCPVEIDLHHLLLENRRDADERRELGAFWPLAMKAWAWVMARRERVEWAGRLARWGEGLTPLLVPKRKRKRVPPLARRSFAEQWRRHERSR